MKDVKDKKALALLSLLWLSTLAALSSACPAVDPGVVADVDEAAALKKSAQTKFPRVVDMHQKIVARSCAPNTGVCHNTNNYPELSSTSAFVQSVNAWCNVASPDPTQGFDLCERHGDVLVSGSFRSEIASTRRSDDGEGWRITLRDPAPRTDDIAPVRFEDKDRGTVFEPFAEWGVTVGMVEGDTVVVVSIAVEEPFFTEPFIDEALSGLIQGDANDNGVFGADANDDDDDDDVARVIAPGSLTRSYLWGRITGTVPGTRMPLANQALADDEYVAVACFIEGLADNAAPDDDAAIDYDGCDFANAPIKYAEAVEPTP